MLILKPIRGAFDDGGGGGGIDGPKLIFGYWGCGYNIEIIKDENFNVNMR